VGGDMWATPSDNLTRGNPEGEIKTKRTFQPRELTGNFSGDEAKFAGFFTFFRDFIP